jgi:hypothetical protein
LNGSSPCKAMGTATYSTEYDSLDRDGSARFRTEFRFVSEDNLIAFENAPFSYLPKYGGFCAWAISSFNGTTTSKAPWSRDWLGPPVDLLNSWRFVKNAQTGLTSLYLFGGEEGLQQFLKGLPETAEKADKLWKFWWGKHGVEPPYAIDGGPFNSACFTATLGEGDGSEALRDCQKNPQPLPPPGLSVPPPQKSSSQTVILIRHGEKDGGNDLSPRGYQRAQCLPKHFADVNITHLYAYTDHPSKRSVETLTPLSDAIHVPIDTKTKRDDVLGLVNRIAALPSNSIVLVCWEHKVLKQIALALGVSDPPDYPSHVYDTEWTIMEHGEKMIKSQEGC